MTEINNDRRPVLYTVLNEFLGRRDQCEVTLKQAGTRPANTVDDIDANLDAIEDALANLCAVTMTIRDIADELIPLDPEREVELTVLREKYNTAFANLLRTEPTQEERQRYREMLGLGAAVGSNSIGGQRA
jgi:hypothetical protein